MEALRAQRQSVIRLLVAFSAMTLLDAARGYALSYGLPADVATFVAEPVIAVTIFGAGLAAYDHWVWRLLRSNRRFDHTGPFDVAELRRSDGGYVLGGFSGTARGIQTATSLEFIVQTTTSIVVRLRCIHLSTEGRSEWLISGLSRLCDDIRGNATSWVTFRNNDPYQRIETIVFRCRDVWIGGKELPRFQMVYTRRVSSPPCRTSMPNSLCAHQAAWYMLPAISRRGIAPGEHVTIGWPAEILWQRRSGHSPRNMARHLLKHPRQRQEAWRYGSPCGGGAIVRLRACGQDQNVASKRCERGVNRWVGPAVRKRSSVKPLDCWRATFTHAVAPCHFHAMRRAAYSKYTGSRSAPTVVRTIEGRKPPATCMQQTTPCCLTSRMARHGTVLWKPTSNQTGSSQRFSPWLSSIACSASARNADDRSTGRCT